MSTHVTFTLRRENRPTFTLNGNEIPQEETAKYLGIYLDRRLTWPTHMFAKRKQMVLKFQIHIHSFIQYSVWRQVQSLLQNDSST